jgi:23S rRNA (uracil1939-C5)-methyltransferase
VNLHCRHFPRCGGCQILDLDYPAQLKRKQEEVERHFADWPGLRVDPILPSPRVEGYRHKVQLPFGTRRTRAGAGVTLGCYAAGSHAVVDQEECLVQEPGLSRVAWAVRRWAGEEGLPIYREDTGTGWLRHLLLRRGGGTGEVLLGLVTNGPGPEFAARIPSLVRAAREALSAGGEAGELAGVVQNLNPERTNVVLGGEEKLLWGRPFLRESLGPFSFPVGLSTFFQINPFQTPRLYDRVLAEVPEGSHVLDLYCGIGSITLWVSRRARRVLGIEENPVSVDAAARAAQANGVGNVEFLASDVARALTGLEPGSKAERRFEIAIVDPPRKGLEAPARDSLKRLGLDRLIYVSCFPATLARDARSWEGAFRLRSVAPVDMFPHTLHVECVAVLEAV